MPKEQDFIDAINANPDDRTIQLVYADWLEEQCDQRGEAWRVLIGEGKRPKYYDIGDDYDWYNSCEDSAHTISLTMFIEMMKLREMMNYSQIEPFGYTNLFEAMNEAAIAWVRCHRDPDFDPLGMMGYCPHDT